MRPTKPKPATSSTKCKRKPKAAAPPAPILTPEGKLNTVFKWIVAGQNAHDIYEAIAKSFPNEKPTDLILAAMGKLKDAADFDNDVVIGWCFESTRELYRRMVEIGDYGGALRAIKQIAEITRYVPSTPEPAEETTKDDAGIADAERPIRAEEGGQPAAQP